MSRDALDVWDRELETTRAAIQQLGPWGHNVRLPNGLETAPEKGDDGARVAQALLKALPSDLGDKTILDVSCRSGLYAYTLAARGARVLGVEPDGRFIEQARWLRRKLGHPTRVRLRHAPVYALARMDESFDIVIMMEGLDAVRYPSLAVDLAVEKAETMVVVRPPATAHVDAQAAGGDRTDAWTRHLETAGAVPRRGPPGLLVCDVRREDLQTELLAATGRPLRRRSG